MADKVKLDDVVKVVSPIGGGYSGKFVTGDVAVVAGEYDDDGFVNLGDERDSPFWVRDTHLEVVTQDVFSDDTAAVGQKWVALEDSTNWKGFKKGETYEVVAATCNCCKFGFQTKPLGRPFTSKDILPPMALVSDAPMSVATFDLEAAPVKLGWVDEVEDMPALVFPTPDPVVSFPTPTVFNDLDDNEKGMLLLAEYEGQVIQFFDTNFGEWLTDESPDPFSEGDFAYRAKPQALIDAENAFEESTKRTNDLKAELEKLAANI